MDRGIKLWWESIGGEVLVGGNKQFSASERRLPVGKTLSNDF